MRRYLHLASLGFALALALSAGAASAEVTYGIEVRGEVAFTDPVRGGPTGAMSIGYAADTYPLLIVPEVVVSAGVWPDEVPVIPFRAMAGARFGLTTVVEPAVFLHLGYGFLARDEDLTHGFAIESGVSVDGRIRREVTLGGALGYQGFVSELPAHGMFAAFRFAVWFD